MTTMLALCRRHPGGAAGLLLLAGVLLLALAARWLYPGNPWDMVEGPFLPPLSPGLPLGSDMLGRDVAAGIVHGTRATLLLGAVSAGVAMTLGVGLGALAGYHGGRLDHWIVGLIEVFQTIPGFLLAVVVVAILTPSLGTVTGAIALVTWPGLARLVRAEFLSLRQREFVQAAVLAGQSAGRVILTQILPNALAPIIVSGSMMVASAILLESALSFLGLGDPDTMTWGYLIGASRSVLRDAWWMSAFPGLAILLTVLALNLVGEALNDALDPRRSGTGVAA
ncbi:Putative polyamine transporter; Oligopeptide transport system permease protein OppC (TC 3.A.1.5.1) [plant metagenome]|uniref:Polyamine transporter Oligopeptide transport system permease protein OppC (TC 3.A.1.5.1) n=1 Tax=plant metagenome TaxID=1297885 RepID=A0A484UCW9_9ZZZZ